MSDETAHEPPANPEIHFEPIVTLPQVEIKSLEENEKELFQSRAKLYRYDTNGDESEWKERGVGVIKILKHKEKNTYRILMRRDKTLKICANHLVTTDMELKPNCGSDKAWVYSVAAEFADEECKSETLAIKFGNPENAKKFKEKFEECQKAIGDKDVKSEEQESDKLAKELEGLNVKESKDAEKDEESKDTSETTTSSKTETVDKEEKKKEDEDVPEK